MCCILPYIDQLDAWNLLPTAQSPAKDPLPVYVCPADPRATALFGAGGGFGSAYGMTDYVGVAGYDYYSTGTQMGIINDNGIAVTISQVTDGTSNTLIVAERPFSVGIANSNYPDPYYWGWWSYPSGPDNLSGAANNSPFYTQNLTGQACPAGPCLFGGGPLNVNNPCSFNYLWSCHTGGSNMAFADGTVRYITYAGKVVVQNCSTFAGGESNTDTDGL